ncbi:hypothetical protein H4219_005288 [Mycoemilia scoparia]|uniref:Uncharacterized protein n=1 Tax=Mycoemilia scoparia TaxID=417184 RepID=A0A9W8DQD4_9FUNG|nr:hypothetical protein H4219_005288 [Mycoemilia scoparia]
MSDSKTNITNNNSSRFVEEEEEKEKEQKVDLEQKVNELLELKKSFEEKIKDQTKQILRLKFQLIDANKLVDKLTANNNNNNNNNESENTNISSNGTKQTTAMGSRSGESKEIPNTKSKRKSKNTVPYKPDLFKNISDMDTDKSGVEIIDGIEVPIIEPPYYSDCDNDSDQEEDEDTMSRIEQLVTPTTKTTFNPNLVGKEKKRSRYEHNRVEKDKGDSEEGEVLVDEHYCPKYDNYTKTPKVTTATESSTNDYLKRKRDPYPHPHQHTYNGYNQGYRNHSSGHHQHREKRSNYSQEYTQYQPQPKPYYNHQNHNIKPKYAPTTSNGSGGSYFRKVMRSSLNYN